MSYDDQPGFRGAGGPPPSSPPPSPPSPYPTPPAPPGAHAPSASPATVGSDLSFASSVGTAVGARNRDRYKPRHSYQARSPLPHLVVLIVLIGIFVAVILTVDSDSFDMSTDAVGTATEGAATDGGANNTGLSSDEWLVLVGIGAILLAFVSVCVLISRIGRNVRGMVSTFGGWTAFFALPLWHTEPLGRLDPYRYYGFGTLLFVFMLSLLLALVGYGILQARLFHRLWEAGGFAGPRWSALLWAPPAVGWITVYASATFTVLSIGSDGTGSSSWEPTVRMEAFAGVASLVCAVGVFALLVAVSIAQHRGIAADRAAIRAERANVSARPDKPGQQPTVA